jgi:cell wall-associated NlpC family hydrolase
MFARSPWRTGGRTAPSVVAAVLAAGMSVLLLPGPAWAAPSDQPGGTSAVLESKALDELQRRAAEVQADLQAQQGEVVEAREAQTAAEQLVAEAEAVLADAESELAGHQDVVAGYAAAVYRDGGAVTPLTLLLSGEDPGEVVSALGFLDVVDAHAAEVIGAAEELRQVARAEREKAQAALDQARAQADEVAGRVAELEAAAAAVAEELDATLAEVDRQLATLQEEQVDVNDRTAANWQAYVDSLAAARVDGVPAADLRDPAASLPPALVPVGASGGQAQPGAAQLPRQPTSLLVLPAEILRAVSGAMATLGLPYAPGTAGPESWDCGSLVRSVYGGAGIELPGTQAELFAVTRPVDPADVLPGDLVFLGNAESGLGHVGIALDAQTMLAADGRAGAVVVRTLPADQVLGVGRPSLGQRAPVAAPGPTGGALKVECGNSVRPTSYGGTRAWGGYPNGLIPPSAMCPLGQAGHSLRCDAAAAYRAMSAAFAGAFGKPICITDSYRTYASQVRLYGQKPALAAVPGTSNHGWGLAVDLCGGIQNFGTPQYNWMKANAGRFGYLHPDWAEPGNGREEPWHWEFAGT